MYHIAWNLRYPQASISIAEAGEGEALPPCDAAGKGGRLGMLPMWRSCHPAEGRVRLSSPSVPWRLGSSS